MHAGSSPDDHKSRPPSAQSAENPRTADTTTGRQDPILELQAAFLRDPLANVKGILDVLESDIKAGRNLLEGLPELAREHPDVDSLRVALGLGLIADADGMWPHIKAIAHKVASELPEAPTELPTIDEAFKARMQTMMSAHIEAEKPGRLDLGLRMNIGAIESDSLREFLHVLNNYYKELTQSHLYCSFADVPLLGAACLEIYPFGDLLLSVDEVNEKGACPSSGSPGELCRPIRKEDSSVISTIVHKFVDEGSQGVCFFPVYFSPKASRAHRIKVYNALRNSHRKYSGGGVDEPLRIGLSSQGQLAMCTESHLPQPADIRYKVDLRTGVGLHDQTETPVSESAQKRMEGLLLEYVSRRYSLWMQSHENRDLFSSKHREFTESRNEREHTLVSVLERRLFGNHIARTAEEVLRGDVILDDQPSGVIAKVGRFFTELNGLIAFGSRLSAVPEDTSTLTDEALLTWLEEKDATAVAKSMLSSQTTADLIKWLEAVKPLAALDDAVLSGGLAPMVDGFIFRASLYLQPYDNRIQQERLRLARQLSQMTIDDKLIEIDLAQETFKKIVRIQQEREKAEAPIRADLRRFLGSSEGLQSLSSMF